MNKGCFYAENKADEVYLFVYCFIFSLLLVGCEFETGSSDVSSISSEQSSSESPSSVLEELEIDFSGLEESKH